MDGSGNTALHSAAEKGYWEIVKALLGEGADSYQKNSNAHTAWDLAVAGLQVKVLEAILERDESEDSERKFPNPLSSFARQLLLKAIEYQCQKTAESLLAEGVPVTRDHLVLAAKWGSREIFQALRDVRAVDSGETLLSLAIKHKQIKNVRLLLDNGAHLDEGLKTSEEMHHFFDAVSAGDHGDLAASLVALGVPARGGHQEGVPSSLSLRGRASGSNSTVFKDALQRESEGPAPPESKGLDA